ncbi:hypothetical protein J7M28_05900 [bacterium]|nr:hypothetical protein [bacterium]
MKDYSTEADARIIYDDLLRQAGWEPLEPIRETLAVEMQIEDDLRKLFEDVEASS